KGEAEASAILAKGDAEAETTRARAEAYKQFNDAAVLAQVLEVLPNVANELASPYSNIENLSVFSTDGEAKIGQNISVGLAQVLDMVKSTTGVDFQDTLQRAAEGGREVRAASDPGSPQRRTRPAAVGQDQDTAETGGGAPARSAGPGCPHGGPGRLHAYGAAAVPPGPPAARAARDVRACAGPLRTVELGRRLARAGSSRLVLATWPRRRPTDARADARA